MSELAYLRWLATRLGRRRPGVVVDRGDDCAVVRVGREQLLLKVDTVIERVHFAPGTPWRLVGRKAMARPLSDIAAMGGVPAFALVSMVLGRRMPMAAVRALTRGLDELGVPIVGGDTKSHAGRCVLSVSVLGEMRGAHPVLRSGARPGDVLMVTGPLGASRRGHHLTFAPRLAAGRRFATTHRVHAMIDISDGLVRDLAHLHAGAELRAAWIPRRGTLAQALYDGEDYELLVAAPAPVATRIARAGLAIAIGVVDAGRGIRLRHEDGRIERLRPRGYEHRFG